MDKFDKTAICFVLAGLALLVLPFVIDSDTGLAARELHSSPVAEPADRPGDPSSSRPEAGVRLSQPEAHGAQGDPAPNNQTGVVHETKLRAVSLSGYEDSLLPTEAGLIDMTLGLWTNEDFLALTQDEAHTLLALDDTMGMKGPDSMLSIVGPLPTEDDCRVGFRSPRVRGLLQEVCEYDIMLAELGGVPKVRRRAGIESAIGEIVAMRDAAMLEMMKALEEETTFGGWRLWWRMYREWSC